MEAIIFFLVFFLSLLFFLYAGSKVAQYQKVQEGEKKSFGYQLLQGSIFSLMGLIVAFTFATSNQKMDMRRILIIDEANAIGTAYLRLDLLPQEQRNILKKYVEEYLSVRLATYKALPDLIKVNQEINKANDIQKKIWAMSVDGCKKANDGAVCVILLPALNEMFDIANKRIEVANLHPPFAVFYLLIGIAILSAFLVGYDMKKKEKKQSMIFIVSYLFVIAFTIYIIVDIEYPRFGLIQINSFDRVLGNALAIST